MMASTDRAISGLSTRKGLNRLGLLFAISVWVAGQSPLAGQNIPQRPNIVLIMAAI